MSFDSGIESKLVDEAHAAVLMSDSALDSAFLSPVKGALQITDAMHLTENASEKVPNLVDKSSASNSLESDAIRIGAAVGYLFDFTVLNSLTSRLIGPSTLQAQVLTGALTGGALSGILRPITLDKQMSTADFFRLRSQHALVGAVAGGMFQALKNPNPEMISAFSGNPAIPKALAPIPLAIDGAFSSDPSKS
jgi:hypothetical protein